METTKTEAYFLCSESLIRIFPTFEHSKPFKSGFIGDDEDNYVALICFADVEKYYAENENVLEFENFWCRECVAGTMDVSKITLAGMRRNGIFSEINEKLNITTNKNIAMVIFELSRKYCCTPIELINKIV